MCSLADSEEVADDFEKTDAIKFEHLFSENRAPKAICRISHITKTKDAASYRLTNTFINVLLPAEQDFFLHRGYFSRMQ